MHAPLEHVYVRLHLFDSVHEVPSATAGFEQTPDAGSHTPAAWHASLALQTTGFEPTHAPAWQESDCVQALPSLHAVPLGAAGFEQVPELGLQVPAAWH